MRDIDGILVRFSALVEGMLKTTEEPVVGKASRKLDGIHTVASKDGITTKTGKPVNQPHLDRRLKRYFKKNPEKQLHGELYRKGMPFEDIVSAHRTANAKLKLYLHPGQEGSPLPVLGIRKIREKQVSTPEQSEKFFRKAVKRGYEGQVTRTPDGTRYKRKPVYDDEFPVSEVGDTTITVKNGDRSFRVKRPPQNVKPGDNVTVKYSGKTKYGNLRHPRAKAVRNDDY